jgi:putative oxidoreductase
MERYLGRYSGEIYALARIVAGFLFACHGAQKFFFSDGPPPEMPAALFWTAGVIELFGGALVALGLATGWAAFITSGQMAVAYFLAHQPEGLLPIQNRGELAALYSFVFLLIASRGSGMWSLDVALGRSRSR